MTESEARTDVLTKAVDLLSEEDRRYVLGVLQALRFAQSLREPDAETPPAALYAAGRTGA